MDSIHEKGKETRQRNAEARIALLTEQTEAIRSARRALTRVMESADATPEQILEAARLLSELSKF